MGQTFFRTPFAASGDVIVIPEAAQSDGEVSFTQGFGPDYQAAPSNPAVLYPERRVVNEILRLLTENAQVWQVHNFPDYILAAQNAGINYSYDKNAFVRWTDGNIYYSLVNSNTADPTDNTKWAQFNPSPPSLFQTGMMIYWEDIVLATGGWVWANGQTIGNAASNATGRANADTAALFAQIWRAFPNAVRPIRDSAGALSTRGANAAADYAANKTLPLRNMCGFTGAGWNTMGGVSDSGNLKPANSLGVDGAVFGSSGGEGTGHAPTLAEMFSHAHSLSGVTTSSTSITPTFAVSRTTGPNEQYPLLQGSVTTPGTFSADNLTIPPLTLSGNTQAAGGGQAFNVVQPTTICNFIIKL